MIGRKFCSDPRDLKPFLSRPTLYRQVSTLSSITNLKTLIVDDEEILLRVMARRLGARHEVLTARSGPRALETIERYEGSIDAIVCDLGMPGMSGVELSEIIAERWPELYPRIRFMSGAPEWGADGSPIALDRRCFRKPLEIPELLEDVDTLISDRRGER